MEVFLACLIVLLNENPLEAEIRRDGESISDVNVPHRGGGFEAFSGAPKMELCNCSQLVAAHSRVCPGDRRCKEYARIFCLSEAGLASGFWRVESAVTSPNFSASFDYLISDVSFHLLTVFLNEGIVL